MRMQSLRKAWLIAVFCFPGLCGFAAATEIRVAVDRNPVNLNESFQITFSASEEPDDSPDFSPLGKDFEVLNQQRSSNMSWVNGKGSRNEQWIISAMARRAGDLLIPAIAFGSDRSNPLPLTVSDKSQTAPGNSDEVFLEVEATPERPYVQSQVLYTLKLYRRVQMSQASLNEPQIRDALVVNLGEDSTYSTQINGMDYWVTERKYAIFPQQSGLMTIEPLTLTAEVVRGQRPRFNGFFSRQLTETRRISSKAITLNVQSVPQSFANKAWLSAESLQLSENWSDTKIQAKVGEPLTRTITLVGKGTTVGQLPELTDQVPIDGLKIYPDQPVLNEEKHSNGLLARREEKVAYIPSQPGEFTLPELRIAWFNTKTRQTEVALLPAVTLHALPAAVAPAPTSNKSETAKPVVSSGEPAVQERTDPGYWPWVAGSLALGWLIHGVLMHRHRRLPANEKQAQETADTRSANIERQLKNACDSNDHQRAREALLSWARSQFGVTNLSALAHLCEEPLAGELLQLNRYLYGSQTTSWNGQLLWAAFAEQNKGRQRQSALELASNELEPLYKF